MAHGRQPQRIKLASQCVEFTTREASQVWANPKDGPDAPKAPRLDCSDRVWIQIVEMGSISSLDCQITIKDRVYSVMLSIMDNAYQRCTVLVVYFRGTHIGGRSRYLGRGTSARPEDIIPEEVGAVCTPSLRTLRNIHSVRLLPRQAGSKRAVSSPNLCFALASGGDGLLLPSSFRVLPCTTTPILCSSTCSRMTGASHLFIFISHFHPSAIFHPRP